MLNSRLSAFLSLVLVFCSGAVLGVVAYRLYAANAVVSPSSPPAKRPTPEDFVKSRLAELKERAHADDQQLEQIRQIYNGTHDQFNQLRAKMDQEAQHEHATIDAEQVAKIKAVLRPDQIPIFEQLRAEHADRARKRKQQQHDNEHK